MRNSKILWGAATSAYQVEGACFKDGKGLNVWDEFYKINNFEYNGDKAVDHYNLMEKDVELFNKIGLQTYRFSVSWVRIFPTGEGDVNKKGLDFYDRLVNKLLDYGIEPNITLYHWDMPLELMRNGGWLNKKTIDSFVKYSKFLFKHFNGRVKLWSTINEPASEVIEGYIQAAHPPMQKDYKKAIQVSHNLNIASAKAIKEFRLNKIEGKIGIVLNPMPIDILEETEENIYIKNFVYSYLSDWYICPAITGKYPKELLGYYKEIYDSPIITPEEEEVMKKYKGDYLGINYYMRRVVEADDINNTEIEKKYRYIKVPNGKYTKWGWEIYPKGLSALIERIYNDYGNIEIIISENGMGFDDKINEKFEFIDFERIEYLSSHINEVKELKSRGYNISAYYVWSAIDLLSWTNGYNKRYGLIGVDFKTMQRTIKLSGEWYKNFIESENL